MRYLILIFLLTSCGPTFYLKKAERALKKAEQLGAKTGVDTIYAERLVFVDSIRVDSIFSSKVDDTVYLTKDRLKVKYVRLPGDSVFIEGRCEADTIKIQVPVSVTKTIESGYTAWDIIRWCLVIAIIAVLVSKILWK
jgi:hypothetical protein